MVHFNSNFVSKSINKRAEDLEKGLVLLVSLFRVMQRCHGMVYFNRKCVSKSKSEGAEDLKLTDIDEKKSVLLVSSFMVMHTVHCFCFTVKKFHGLMSFLSFPEKLSWLPVTLFVLSIFDSKYSQKNFRGDKGSAKSENFFTAK